MVKEPPPQPDKYQIPVAKRNVRGKLISVLITTWKHFLFFSCLRQWTWDACKLGPVKPCWHSSTWRHAEMVKKLNKGKSYGKM